MNAAIILPVRPPKLSRGNRVLFYAITTGLWLSGAAWLEAHFFLMRSSPFGPSPHPLEFWSRAAHGAFGFASLWLLGILSAAHIAAGWRNQQRRWTGTVMLAVIACLLVSGYLLYYLRDDRLIAATALLHWSGGLAAPLAFLLHRFAQTARKKRRHATSAG
jgi:hypothetical protein